MSTEDDTVDLDIPVPPDRTGYLQQCIDSDQAIPPGTWAFADRLVIGSGKKLVGEGPNRTKLLYTGWPHDEGAIIVPPDSWAYSLCGFMLSNYTTNRPGCGIRGGATDTGQFGTQSGFALIDDVWVDGFGYGLRFGDKTFNTSSSEITMANLHVENCDVGCRIETQNSLDYTFVQLGIASCRIGLETDQAGMIHILGGSASNVLECVWSLNGAGVFSLRNLRVENSGYLLSQGFALPRFSITIDSCETSGGTRKDGVDVSVRGGAALQMKGGTYYGHVQYEGSVGEPPQGYGSISLDSVGTRDKTLLTSPNTTKCRYTIRDCAMLDSNGQVLSWVNGAGTIGTATRIPAH